MNTKKGIFLTAQWKNLILLNYEIDPETLLPYVPPGTELDFFEGKTYVSLVGFLFQDTRVKGFKVPFHVNFEEVNLRFYVKHTKGNKIRRGVCFIKEIVPRKAIAFIANTIYKENYVCLKMQHLINEKQVLYKWYFDKQWHYISATLESAFSLPKKDSLEEFITEHYWGYSSNGKGTIEYQVEHPTWEVANLNSFDVKVGYELLYGSKLGSVLSKGPANVIFAKGSEVIVYEGKKYF